MGKEKTAKRNFSSENELNTNSPTRTPLLDYRHPVSVGEIKDLPSENDTTTLADPEQEEFGNDVYDADQTLRSLRIPNYTDKPIEVV
jgi:hypothetical protein